jgi:hypothetical protein
MLIRIYTSNAREVQLTLSSHPKMTLYKASFVMAFQKTAQKKQFVSYFYGVLT